MPSSLFHYPPALGRRWNIWIAVILTVFLNAGSWVPVTNAAALPGAHLQDQARATVFANGVELRVLPLGDSITNGQRYSSDVAGYRSRLYALMTQQFSNTIHFVGSLQSGNFVENHHDGHNGYFISQIETASAGGFKQGPNIVLLHAGTNDEDHGDTSKAIPNLIHLINTIFTTNPNTAIFLAQITPSTLAGTDKNITQYNSDIANYVVPKYKGKRLVLVDMNTGFNKSNLADKVHPNDTGYLDMANRWLKAITASEKIIVAPRN